MNCIEEKYLRSIVGIDTMKKLEEISSGLDKTAESNVLENSMWSNMIDGALKALEIVALASLDWKLTGIVKLLQSWLKDKREEKERQRMQYQEETNDTYDPWGGSTYY